MVVAGVVAKQAVPVGLTENGGAQDLVGCALGDESAIEDQHPVAVASLVQIVGGDHHGRPGRSLLADHLEDPLLAGEVETGDRLVEQQQRRMPGACLRPEGPLPLAAREFADLAVEQVADFESGDGVVDGCPIAGGESAGEWRSAEAPHPHNLGNREREPTVVVVLGDQGHTGSGREEPARLRGQQAGEDLEECGLARTVWPDQGRGGARPEVGRHRVEGQASAAPDGDVDELQGVDTGIHGENDSRPCGPLQQPRLRAATHQRLSLGP